MKSLILTANNIVDKCLRVLLCLSLGAMCVASFAPIVGRLMGLGVIWPEPFARHMVFVVTFLGALLASGQKKHIRIDLLRPFLKSSKADPLIQILVHLFSMIVLLFLCHAGWELYRMEADYDKEFYLFVKSSHVIALLPFSFLLLAFREFSHFILSLSKGEG